MVISKNVSAVPDVPKHIRGILNLRGNVIHCIDLRLKLDMVSMNEEIDDFSNLMDARKEDHIKWLDELKNSVTEKREFKLTLDPHACKFGKWYDSFQTSNIVLASLIKKFDEPHRQIHQLGKTVKSLEEKEQYEIAHEEIEKTKNTDLKEMIKLFSLVKEEFRNNIREITLVLERKGETIGIIVDEVFSVEHLLEGSIENLDEKIPKCDIPLNVGKRRKDQSLVMILGENYICL